MNLRSETCLRGVQHNHLSDTGHRIVLHYTQPTCGETVARTVQVKGRRLSHSGVGPVWDRCGAELLLSNAGTTSVAVAETLGTSLLREGALDIERRWGRQPMYSIGTRYEATFRAGQEAAQLTDPKTTTYHPSPSQAPACHVLSGTGYRVREVG